MGTFELALRIVDLSTSVLIVMWFGLAFLMSWADHRKRGNQNGN